MHLLMRWFLENHVLVLYKKIIEYTLNTDLKEAAISILENRNKFLFSSMLNTNYNFIYDIIANELEENVKIINSHKEHLTKSYIDSFLLNKQTDETIFLFLLLLFPNEGLWESFICIKDDIDYRNVKYFLIKCIFDYIILKEEYILTYKNLLIKTYFEKMTQENRLSNNLSYIPIVNLTLCDIEKILSGRLIMPNIENWLPILNASYSYNILTGLIEPVKLLEII